MEWKTALKIRKQEHTAKIRKGAREQQQGPQELNGQGQACKKKGPGREKKESTRMRIKRRPGICEEGLKHSA
jgi:hypothetical protein